MIKKEFQTPIPNDPDELRKLVFSLSNKVSSLELNNESLQFHNETLHQKNIRLQERVTLLEFHIFARKSEKISAEDKQQMYLFDEAETVATAEEGTDPEAEKSEKKSYSGKRGRKPIPANIPRERVVLDLDPEEKTCSCCGEERPAMGSEISEELVYIPAEIKVIEHEKKKYGPCKCSDFADSEDSPILTAKAAPRMMPGSIASASLLAYTITGKYCDSLPFYRQERIFKRLGIDISRTNMCNWTIKTASKCADLIDLMRDQTREGPLINMDETTLQVLKEPKRMIDSKSYMWVTIGSDSGHKIVLFNYSRTRKAQIAEDLLEGFKGSLQTDGYAGYNSTSKKYGLWHVGCLAHIRRKFIDAAKASKSGGQSNKAIKLIKKLYTIEKELRNRDLSPDEFVRIRREKAIPVLKEFRKWLNEKKKTVVPSLAFGKAINYASSEYVRLVRYLKYDYLTPDNNAAENSIRPFVIGRKNWLFNDTPKGAHASAALYSLVETAKANDVEPMHYLNYIFQKIPMISDKNKLEALLPWNIQKADLIG